MDSSKGRRTKEVQSYAYGVPPSDRVADEAVAPSVKSSGTGESIDTQWRTSVISCERMIRLGICATAISVVLLSISALVPWWGTSWWQEGGSDINFVDFGTFYYCWNTPIYTSHSVRGCDYYDGHVYDAEASILIMVGVLILGAILLSLIALLSLMSTHRAHVLSPLTLRDAALIGCSAFALSLAAVCFAVVRIAELHSGFFLHTQGGGMVYEWGGKVGWFLALAACFFTLLGNCVVLGATGKARAITKHGKSQATNGKL